MESIIALKDRVALLENTYKSLRLKSLDLDKELRTLRKPSMDFSKLEYRQSSLTQDERVWKDECALCFATPYTEKGLFVNLKTLSTFCYSHALTDWEKTNKNCLYLRQQWEWISEEEDDDEVEKKKTKTEPEVKKLALGMEGGFKLDTENGHIEKIYSLCTGPNFLEDYATSIDTTPNLQSLISTVIKRDDASRQLDVMAWEASNDLFESKYARNLVQLENGVKISSDPKTWKCADSGMTENLWLNLSTGYIGSGRKNWDGTGGTGAALKHFEQTGCLYPLVVKLGTITPDGKADVYSYAPDEEGLVIDPLLTTHLAHWGINVGELRKTEKTMAEMEVDLNVKYDWSRISEEGKELQKVNGPHCVGLVNLGNSCYCNSVYQSLFGSPQFSQALLGMGDRLPATNQPQFDLGQQFVKLGKAMNNPLAFVRPLSHKPFAGSDYVAPRMLKTLLGDRHRDFATNEQQDAADYVSHLLERFHRYLTSIPQVENITDWFTLETEERIQCLQSNQVRYKRASHKLLQLNVPYIPKSEGDDESIRPTVSFLECVEATLGDSEIVDDFLSTATGKRGQASKTTTIATYPKLLLVQLRRFVPNPNGGWDGIKLEYQIPKEIEFDFGHKFQAKGLQPNEKLLPTDLPENQLAADPQIIERLMEQGFSKNGATRAANATKNNFEAAVNWIMEHMNDVDFNAPVGNETASSAFIPSPDIISSIEGMGFSRNGAIRAATATNNNAEAAINWVMEHMGDDDFNDALPAPQVTSTQSSSFSEEAIEAINNMGFSREIAQFVLKKCDGNLERAADYAFSRTMDELESEIASATKPASETTQSTPVPADLNQSTKYFLRAVISHVGKSTQSGHYVAHVNQASNSQEKPRWIFFNDEKAVLAENPPLDLGYLLLYEQL